MKSLFKKFIAIILAAIIVFAQVPAKASAAVTDYQKAQVSFTFDDGFTSMYQTAPAILKAAGYEATLYYITGLGDGTYQNGTTDDDKAGMTWAQVQDLQTNYGWEIGSHTEDHALLSTYTAAQVDADIEQANTALIAHGINPTTFAFPEGDYLNPTLVETAKYYAAARGFQDVGLETFPYNNIVIHDESLDKFMTLAQAEAFVDQAIANKQTLVFTGHGIEAKANKNYDYVWTTADFQALVSYVKSKNVPVVKLGDAVKKPGVNLTTNQSFENGLAGWTTDDATNVVVDTNTNGSYPSPKNAINMTASASATHLFSGLISVVPGKDYLVDAFYNALNLTSGEFGYFIDEYDAGGNWISGQWLGAVTNGTIGFFDKVIQATSNLVASFGVQTYLTGGSTGNVYSDNINLYDMTATPSATPTIMPTATPTATPSGTPSVTPTPVQNLIVNGDFDSGLANGWTTDNATTVKADSANHGANPTAATSIGLTGSATAAHLFYGLLTVDPSATYNLSVNANTTGLTSGELGFYMDEYDASGTWISGQWLGDVLNGVTTAFTKVYKATSTLVSQIRVQTYLTANSTGTGYVDSFNLTNQSATPSATPSVTVTPTATPVPGQNEIVNGDFDSGLANGWTTDNATQVQADSNNHGTNPTTATSIAMNGGTAAAHLFYSFIKVDPTVNYLLTAVADATGLTTGEFGYYVDEYDANGTWVSGQWLAKVTNGVVTTFNRVYKATSTLVSQIRVQTYLTAGATGTAYVDGYTMSNQSGTTPTPSISVTPTATPSGTPSVTPAPGANLVANNSFETVNGAFPTNWTTDNVTNVLLDTTTKGTDGANTIHFNANTVYSHIFSDLITLPDATSTYTWSTYVNTVAAGGEFGFYVDEYDANGNWISGQWKGMINALFTGVESFSYVPTSTNVKSVRLQYYQTPGSTFDLYIDSINLSK